MLQILNACMPKHTRIETVELSKKTLCEDFWTVCEIMRPALKLNIIRDDTDEAVCHVVNFIHTRRRSSRETQEKKFKRYARRTSLEQDSPSDDEVTFETGEEDNRALGYQPRQINLCQRRQTEPISRENKLKLMQQDRLTL